MKAKHPHHHIKKHLDKGRNLDFIRKQLKTLGYQEKHIEKLIRSYLVKHHFLKPILISIIPLIMLISLFLIGPQPPKQPGTELGETIIKEGMFWNWDGYKWTVGKALETCYDEIQNQGETGIDCGNLCRPCGELTIQTFTNPAFIIYLLVLITLLIIIFIHPHKNKKLKKSISKGLTKEQKIREKLMKQRKKELSYYRAIEKLEKEEKELEEKGKE